MPDTSLLDSFLNESTCSDGDVVEVVNGGVIVEKEDMVSKKKYNVLQVPVKCNGRELTFQPNSDAVEVLSKKYGKNSDAWKGVKFKVKQYPKTSFGTIKTAILPVILL